MKYLVHTVVVLIFSLLFSVTVFGQEVKKQETTSVTTMPTATAQEVLPAGHGHPAIPVKRAVAIVGSDGVQRVEISGGEYYYDPNYIVVKVNRAVELKFKKGADSTFFIPHNMIVKAPEAGIDFNVDIKSDVQSIKFIPTKVGKYPIYCDKKAPFSKTHREKGMEGMIEVVE
jgi:plastocyanin